MAPDDLRKRTKRYALQIIRLYRSLPRQGEARVIGNQILRSGTSVGAQYREACRAKSVRDFINKMEGSLGSLGKPEETAYWLELHPAGKSSGCTAARDARIDCHLCRLHQNSQKTPLIHHSSFRISFVRLLRRAEALLAMTQAHSPFRIHPSPFIISNQEFLC